MMPSGMTIQSPCIRRCCLDDNDICLGCFRSLDEITAWGMSDDGTRLDILARSDMRRAAHKTWYGGEEY
jgi:predicted Fe-S protein YdhL (DUF1289 family)